MMKKLLMWSALLMTGFAFYSCDDVVDNPVQDSTAVWNYAVNVKFADFDFNGLNDPVTNEPYKYEAPKTLYVFNEQLQPLGEITTEKAPAAGVSAKYSGTLHGAIGDNLIIVTKTGVDYAKQDGTIESIIENAIVQLDTVAVRVYSNYNYNVSTDDAKMQNEVAILQTNLWKLQPGDEITVKSENLATEDQTLGIVLSEEEGFNTWNTYLAIPTSLAEEFEYTIYGNSKNGEESKFVYENLNLKNGKLFDIGYNKMEITSVDLTKYLANVKVDNPREDGHYWYNIQPGQVSDEITFTQSGSEALDSLYIMCDHDGIADHALTINFIDVKFGKELMSHLTEAAYKLNVSGTNDLGNLRIGGETTCELEGDGTVNFNAIELSGQDETHRAQLTIDRDINIQNLYAYRGNLIIKEGTLPKINVKYNIDMNNNSSLTVEEGATLSVTGQSVSQNVMNISNNSTLDIADGATLNVQGAKDNCGLRLDHATATLGEKAHVNLYGGPKNAEGLGRGASFQDANVTLGKEATFKAVGMDRAGLEVSGATTIDNAEKAVFTAKDSLTTGKGVVINGAATLNITGEGTFQAISKNVVAWVAGTLNINGGKTKLEQEAGATGPAVAIENYTNGKINIANTITSVTVKCTKATEPICITYTDGAPAEVDLANLVGDVNDFDETTEDGVRTITPVAAE